MSHHTPASSAPDFFSAQVSEARRFYLNLDPPPSRRLVVVSGGCEHCDRDYHIRRSDFPYYSIEFVARGEGWLKLDGQRHALTPGLIFAYGPGISQDIQNNPDRPLVKYFIDFTGAQGKALLRAPAPQLGQVAQTSTPDDVLSLFDELIRTGLRDTPHRDRLCALIVEQLILTIAQSAVPPGSAGTLAFETYQRCRACIERDCLELRSLVEIAERCLVDPAYLCRLFARFDHQSPYQYLTRLRMSHAAQRLQTPGTLAKQVAAEMGFSDPFHFSRTFRRVLGVSPKRFVQLQRPRE
jgi:AraC-like DNA-binding protein